MAESNRRETLIIHNSVGHSVQTNFWAWKNLAFDSNIDVQSWDGDLEVALTNVDLKGYGHVWFADARYIPHPTTTFNTLKKKLPEGTDFCVFAAGEPMATRSFYGEKFTTASDSHDKFGGLRYINVDVEYGMIDEEWGDKPADFVTYRPTRLGFPYAAFMLFSNEPEELLANFKTAETFYPHAMIFRAPSGFDILDSHKAIAEASDTEMFLVFDADFVLETALVTEELKPWEQDSVHLWYARNPVNGLTYGHGGPKAFNRSAFIDVSSKSIDVTTSAHAKRLTVHEQCVGIHQFNWSAESSWRTAFREAAKLFWQRAVAGTKEETNAATKRLNVWTSENDKDSKVPYASECVAGAIAGKAWAERVNKRVEASRINDFEWLHQLYQSTKEQ